jgi:hypothetical protein
MRLDVHTHAFHPKIAAKVLAQLQEHYGIPPAGSGLVEDLLARAAAAGLDGVVVHTAATAPAQVIPANNWAMELQRSHPGVIAFGTAHPGFAGWEAELDRLRAASIRGIKLHPEFQGFWLDDPALLPIIEAAQDDFVFMVHVGDNCVPAQNPSCPFKMAALLERFPRARFIAAHLGGYLHWPYALEALAGRRVWLDTSSSLPFMDQATLEAIFSKHPRELILFGSDYPLFDPADSLAELQARLGLGDADVDRIMGNASRLLGLD